MAASRSSFLIVVTFWNVNRNPARPPGVSRCVAQTDLDHVASVLRPVAEFVAPAAEAAQVARNRFHHRRRELKHLVDRPANRRFAWHARNRFRSAIERQDPQGNIRRGEAARQAVDDVLVEGLQARDLGGRLFQPRAGRSKTFGERSAEERHGKKPEHVERNRVLRNRARRQRNRPVRQPRIRQHSGGRQILSDHELAEQHCAQRRNEQAALPELHDRARDHRQNVQRREVAGHAAGEVDERRHDDCVAGKLHVDEPAVLVDLAQCERVGNGQRVDEPDEKEERIDRKRARRRHLHEGGGPEQHRADDRADDDQPGDFAAEIGIEHCSRTNP